MKYLLYAIFKTPPIPWPVITGVGQQPICFIENRGLTAVVSKMAGKEPPLTIDALKMYEKVMETLFEKTSLIPMQYGCLLDSTKAIVQIVEESGAVYQEWLMEIDGCVEMGIRVVCPMDKNAPRPKLSLPKDNEKSMTGKAYLAFRRNQYEQEDKQLSFDDTLIHTYTHPFKGLFKKSCSEKKTHNGFKSLAIFFLVPRIHIQAFKTRYKQITQDRPEKSFLSGPWPPYNFVTAGQKFTLSHPLIDQLMV